MKRTKYTFGQLEKVLRAFGFLCRPGKNDPPGRIYGHPQTGAIVALPAFPPSDKVYPHHLFTAQMALDDFGIADPATFEAKLQKAG